MEKVLQTIKGKKVLLLTVKFFGEETFLWHCYKEPFPAALLFKSVLPTYLPFRQSGSFHYIIELIFMSQSDCIPLLCPWQETINVLDVLDDMCDVITF